MITVFVLLMWALVFAALFPLVLLPKRKHNFTIAFYVISFIILLFVASTEFHMHQKDLKVLTARYTEADSMRWVNARKLTDERYDNTLLKMRIQHLEMHMRSKETECVLTPIVLRKNQ